MIETTGPDDAASPEQLRYGAVVTPGYRVLSLLSRGVEFETYDAWSEERFARCVVKTIRADRTSPSNRARLRREGMLLTTADHPHLVRGYQTGSRPRPFVVLETLSGATLGHLLTMRRRLLAAADVALLGSQLCAVLQFLHARGYLHLDVKPDNVIIEGGRAKLLDLSLAQPPGRVPPGLGTSAYMSPEQARGGRIASATDVWGVGITLYEAATRTNPFADPSAGAPDRDRRSSGSRPPTGRCATCGGPRDYLQLGERAPQIQRRRQLPRELADAINAALDPTATNRPTLSELDVVLNRVARSDRPPW